MSQQSTDLSLDLKQTEEYWDFWISGFTGRRERVLFLRKLLLEVNITDHNKKIPSVMGGMGLYFSQ